LRAAAIDRRTDRAGCGRSAQTEFNKKGSVMKERDKATKTGQQRKFKLDRMAYAVMLATAAPAAMNLAYAGVGFGDSTNPASIGYDPVTGLGKVRTFYANSELPKLNAAGTAVQGGLRKFIDTMPDLTPAGANSLGQYIPISSSAFPLFGLPSTADTTSYPGSDYYELAIVEYTEKMHPDLPKATVLRGYVQVDRSLTNGGAKSAGSLGVRLTDVVGYPVQVAKENPDHTIVRNADGSPMLVDAYAYDKPHYLGPSLIAVAGVPVRVKYTNCLPVGQATGNATTADANGFQKVDPLAFQRHGDMFIPVDETLAGAGLGPNQFDKFQQNRAEIHLHGGLQPWISDGTPHQWTVPVGDNAVYQKGESFANVPDMPDPGPGAGTLYWTNAQSARLMPYHDHVSGITRINAYVGEAAGYVLVDVPGGQAHNEHTLPIPGTGLHSLEQKVLVIQDKTFVPTDIAVQDAKWDTAAWGQPGDLWFPHVYETNQDPFSADGTNPVGRWDWGPYFWPVFPSQYVLPNGDYGDVTTTPEAFMDTPIVNGAAYPVMNVEPKAYRWRILGIGNDRFFNLGMYEAEPLSIGLVSTGSGYVDPRVDISAPDVAGGTQAVAQALYGVQSINYTIGDSANTYTLPPVVTISAPPAGGIQATATVDLQGLAAGGPRTILQVNVTNPGNGYVTPPTVTISPAPGDGGLNTSFTVTANVGLAGVKVTNYGSGYTKTPTVTIKDGPTGAGPGKGAVAVAAVNTEVRMVPFDSSGVFPKTGGLLGTGWGTPDNRTGGVPDPTKKGPDFIQIGTEAGLLPNPVVIPSTIINYEYNKRSVTVLNVLEHGLYLGPAERADVIVDFSQYAGKTLIIYNDAPAPVPAGDPRIDYYTGDPDFSATGGAPSTLPGYGPNTRTIMQIRVGTTVSAVPSYPTVPGANGYAQFDIAPLVAELPQAYAATQERPIVAESAYNNAFNGGAATWTDQYAGIFTGSLQQPVFKFTSGGSAANFASIKLTDGGTGYITPPAVTIKDPMSGAVVPNALATATLKVDKINIINAGSGYLAAPTVTITSNNGAGAGATAQAYLTVSGVGSLVGGANYSANPTVIFSAPPAAAHGTTALGHAVVVGGVITGIVIDNAGSGYVIPPTIRITDATGSGASAKAMMGIGAVQVTAPNPSTPSASGGFGYTDMNQVAVTFTAPGPGGVAPTVSVTGAVDAIRLINPGNPANTPDILLDAPPAVVGARQATAVATGQGVFSVQPKAIQELFEPTFGRMNSTLGVELPMTSALTQTTIPLNYIDPTTETIADGETQIWKITHNGVDTHPVHFHMVDVQVINRVGWDGTIKAPNDNEVGWKETVRMNPLEDIYVAVRAKAAPLPGFGLPQSVRHRDPSQPEGSPLGFTQMNPVTGTPPLTTIANQLENYDWEYVWHCHILGHEENDMMRPFVLNVPTPAPIAPDSVAAAIAVPNVQLTWADRSSNEFRFDIMRADQQLDAAGNPVFAADGSAVFNPAKVIGTALANAQSYNDATVVGGLQYAYQVCAVAANGLSIPAGTQSVCSNPPVVATDAGAVPAAPTAMTLTVPVFVANAAPTLADPGTFILSANWHDNSLNETGFLVERCQGTAADCALPGAVWVTVGGAPTAANIKAISDSGLLEAREYQYRVSAFNAAGASGVATAAVTTPFAPAVAPTALQQVAATGTTIDLSWANVQPQSGITVSGVGLPAGATLNGATLAPGATSWALAAGTTGAALAGLNPNSTYTINVTSVNGGDGVTAYAAGVVATTATASVQSATQFGAVGAVAASVNTLSATSLQLSLVDAGPVTGYTVVRAATATTPTATYYVAAVAGGTTTWTDPTALAQHTAYSYAVTPWNGQWNAVTGPVAGNGGNAGVAQTAVGTTNYATSAGIVTLTATTPTPTSVQLGWTTTAGAPVTGFVITRTDNVGGAAQTVNVAAPGTPWSDPNPIAAGVTYHYTVTPWNADFVAGNGTGGPAAGVMGGNQGTPSASVSLTTPAALTAVVNTGTPTASSITLTLSTTNSGNANAVQATSYVVTSCMDNGAGGCASAVQSQTVAADALGSATVTFSGLQSGTTYDYTVAAVSGGAGASVTGAAIPASATTVASAYWVAAPTGLAVTVNTTSIRVNFTDASGPAVVPPAGLLSMNETQFVVERSSDGVTYNLVGTVTQSGGTGTAKSLSDVNNLQVGSTYWYRVKAEYSNAAAGVYTPSNYVYINPVNFTVPAQIAATPTATLVTGTSLTLNWVAPANTNGAGVTGLPVTGYAVAQSTGQGTALGVPATTGSTAVTRSYTGLLANTVYNYAVAASNALGTQTAVSPTLSVMTAPATPARPTAVMGAAGSGSVTVNWTAVAGATDYVVQYRSRLVNANNWGAWVTVNGGTTGGAVSLPISGLTAGGTTQYQFHVAASNVTNPTGITGGVSAFGSSSTTVTMP
jgi:FtsP/CotA-like multicopper oxidase with cupredoxin domain